MRVNWFLLIGLIIACNLIGSFGAIWTASDGGWYKNINKPIWVTEAMTGKCNAIETYVNAFLSGAEIIVDVGINAPGTKMSVENRNQLNKFIEKFNNFKSIKKLSANEVEFELDNGSLLKYQY